MPRLQTLLECVARAILESDVRLSESSLTLGDSLMDVARRTHLHTRAELSEADLRTALREAVAAPLETVELSLRDALGRAANGRAETDLDGLVSYLELIPSSLRQFLRRPDDPAGHSVPEQLILATPEDWLPLLPDRRERFQPGDKPANLDNWQVTDLRGFGTAGETWRGWDDAAPENPTACLKFITEPGPRKTLERLSDYFQQILDLEPISGLVPLRSVYLQSDPPCLEWDYLSGYDLAGLMRDWRWRYQKTRPGHAAMIIRRIAKVVGKLHTLEEPLVHRGLKPSNVLLHPTSDGKVTIWISDMGWSLISSAYSLKNAADVQSHRHLRRGAHGALYASPQQQEGEKADPRDDVYALGVMWYQLLQRDPGASPPTGNDWALEFRKLGFKDGEAMLLAACLSPRSEERPANALILADLIAKNTSPNGDGGSKTFQLKGTSDNLKPLSNPSPKADFIAAETPRVSRAQSAKQPRAFQNSLGIQFALIPAGTFMMGSTDDERGHHIGEGPVHKVTITRPFYLSIYPVTQAQYRALIGKNPSHFQRTLGGGPDHPVEQVTWDEAVAFCEQLHLLPEESAESRMYRLPTEAEWEYACRAGTTTPYFFGDTIALHQVHFFGLSATTLAKEVSSVGKTQKVGSHSANAWGLYDMHGNVLEWCSDWWSEEYYAQSPEEDPTGPTEGHQHVVRGGSFSQFDKECRSAARLGRAPASRLNTIGFRVALTIPGV